MGGKKGGQDRAFTIATWTVMALSIFFIVGLSKLLIEYNQARPFILKKNIFTTHDKPAMDERSADSLEFLCKIPNPAQPAIAYSLAEYALNGNQHAKRAMEGCMYSPWAPRSFLCHTLAYVADEKTLPAIISNSRWWPAPVDNFISRDIYHCYCAMRRIANRSHGLEGKDWKKWYSKGRKQKREEWVLEGFQEAGYDITSLGIENLPVFVKAIDDSRRFIRENAVEIIFEYNDEKAFNQLLDSYLDGSLDRYAYKYFIRLLRRTPTSKWGKWMANRLALGSCDDDRLVTGLCKTALSERLPPQLIPSGDMEMSKQKEQWVKILSR